MLSEIKIIQWGGKKYGSGGEKGKDKTRLAIC